MTDLRFPTDPVVRCWIDALQQAYTLTRAERLAEMHDRRPKLMDARGLHPLSLEIGRIQACQEIEPVLRDAEFDPFELRRAARDDARGEFVQTLAREMAW